MSSTKINMVFQLTGTNFLYNPTYLHHLHTANESKWNLGH
uniref:Uncharacterized protein n=1 Tax=Arundo donax TaxID=35708 RepID=A0A0A9H6L8_ARUDO